MKRYVIDNHSKNCHKDRCMPRTEVFFLLGEFRLVCQPTCSTMWGIDYSHRILDKLPKLPIYETRRSVVLDKEFLNIRRGRQDLNGIYHEICHIYNDNAMKKMAIVRFYDVHELATKESIEQELEKTKKYLKSNGMLHEHLDTIKELYSWNYIIPPSKKETFKTTEFLIKKINNEINRKSKHKELAKSRI